MYLFSTSLLSGVDQHAIKQNLLTTLQFKRNETQSLTITSILGVGFQTCKQRRPQLEKRGYLMNIDPKMLDQALGMLPYPVGKQQLIQLAEQFNLNPTIVGLINNLPDQQFNSPEEIKSLIGGLGNLGNLGNLGGLFGS
jgi:hypothetical protein